MEEVLKATHLYLEVAWDVYLIYKNLKYLKVKKKLFKWTFGQAWYSTNSIKKIPSKFWNLKKKYFLEKKIFFEKKMIYRFMLKTVLSFRTGMV